MANPREATVKIERDLLQSAKVVAAYEDKTICAYLSDILRPIIAADHRRHAEAALAANPPTPDS